MFIWDFVADKILGQIVDWFYGQVVGFLGNFFAEMGNMGVELFEMSWVQSIVLFFSYLAWALYGTGLVVACFECGIEYSSGRGNIRETALNAIKGFMAVSLFTVVPVRLYELSVTLQGQLTAGITGYGASIGDVASDIMQEFSAVESLTDLASGPFLGFGSITSGIMILFCIILMAYAIIKVFFANLKRGGMEQVRLVKEMRNADEQRGRAGHAVRPRYMLWENVPGAFSSGTPKGEDFRIVLEEIVRVKCGSVYVPGPYPWPWQSAGRILLGTDFSLAWRCLDAQYWGVAQRRKRIFLVADFAGRTADKILFIPESMFGDPTPSF